MVDSQYYLPNDIGVSALDCSEAFNLLSPQEKMYAHYVSRAAWYVTINTGQQEKDRSHLLEKRIQFLVCWIIWITCSFRYGGLAVLLQTSPESANIFVLLQKIFRKQTPTQLEQVATAAGLSAEEYQVHSVDELFQLQTVQHKCKSFLYLCVWYSGLLGVCSWPLCQHGKLQVFWRHQVHPKST